MPEKDVILEIDHPHFVIRLYEDLLKIDMKGSFRGKVEEALENTPILKETIGGIFGLFVPLHVRLSDIDSARIEKTGKVKIVLPRRRDITIPIEAKEAKRLVDKLNELVPVAKQRELERIISEHKLQKVAEEEFEGAKTMATLASSKFPALMEEEKEAEKEIERKSEENTD
ncbi:MAG: hypothetical protein ABR962_10675 [Candidatus Bathyarchaeia archaeon]|jgi:hypothetical protein